MNFNPLDWLKCFKKIGDYGPGLSYTKKTYLYQQLSKFVVIVPKYADISTYRRGIGSRFQGKMASVLKTLGKFIKKVTYIDIVLLSNQRNSCMMCSLISRHSNKRSCANMGLGSKDPSLQKREQT